MRISSFLKKRSWVWQSFKLKSIGTPLKIRSWIKLCWSLTSCFTSVKPIVDSVLIEVFGLLPKESPKIESFGGGGGTREISSYCVSKRKISFSGSQNIKLGF